MMSLRTLLSLMLLLAALALLAGQFQQLLADPAIWPPDDYVQYWAAGKLALAGENPYSAELLLPLERAAGRRSTATGAAGELDQAIMMWNPPWTLPLVMPLGWLPARVGQILWFLLGLGCFLATAALLWRVYDGPPSLRWQAFLLTFSFIPTFFALGAGQITPLVLLGLALFARWTALNRFFWAGLATVLLGIKPHLVYLLWPLMLADAIYLRRFRLILGGGIGGIALSAIAWSVNPAIFSLYLTELADRPPAQWVSLTIGSGLRLLLGEGEFGWQFLPVPLGLLFALIWWWQQRHRWHWPEQLPVLMLVSLLTAPYGAWHFDLILGLLPLIARAALLARRESQRPLVGFLIAVMVMNLVMLILNQFNVSSLAFIWVTPVIFILTLIWRR